MRMSKTYRNRPMRECAIMQDTQRGSTTSDTAPAAATPAKRRNRRSFKDLMLRRRRKSRDDEPIGVLFERDLDEICQHGTLPPSLTSLLQCLWLYGPRTEGVFRHSASIKTCRKWRDALDAGHSTMKVDPTCVHVAAGLLKELLRKLPNCLLGCHLYQQWLNVADKTPDDAVPVIKSLISKLTANQRLLLHHVILVLRQISAHKSVTRMTSANLAVCVAPAMLWEARRGSLLPDTGDRHMMRDASRLSLAVQRIIDAEDPALFSDHLAYPTPFGDVDTTQSDSSSLCVPDVLVDDKRDTLPSQLSDSDLSRQSSLSQCENTPQTSVPVPPPRSKKLRRQSCFAAITGPDNVTNVNECSRPAVSGEAVAAGNVVPQDSRFQSQNEAAVTRDDSDVTTCRRYRFPLLHSASFDQQSWLDVRYDACRSSSSLPAVCSSRDRPDRKSGALQRRSHQQQSTDSAISVSLEDIDDVDVLSTSSSAASSRLSLLTFAARRDVTSGHVTHVARLRRGMTLSGDDLFPSRMRDSLLMPTSTSPLSDITGRPTTGAITKRRDKPSEPTSETSANCSASPQPEHEEKERVSMSGEPAPRRRLSSLIRRHLNSQQYDDEDSSISTSDNYTSDYEDSGTKFRWRDEKASKSPRPRDMYQRRSYHVTRRRRDVKRSQSDSVQVSRSNAKCRPGRDILMLSQQFPSHHRTEPGQHSAVTEHRRLQTGTEAQCVAAKSNAPSCESSEHAA